MKKEASTEVRRIKKELHSIEANHGEMEFSKLIVEGELKACKRKCEELREQVLKFGSIEASHGEMALSKLIVEDELKAYKRECEELKEQVLRLKEDKGVISDREVRGEERYKKLVEDVKKQEDVQKVRLVELQGRIKELERGKRASEALVELYKSRFEELGSRVLRLEEDAKVLMIEQPLVSKRVEEGVRVVNARSNEVMDTSGDTRGSAVADERMRKLEYAQKTSLVERDRAIERAKGLEEKVGDLEREAARVRELEAELQRVKESLEMSETQRATCSSEFEGFKQSSKVEIEELRAQSGSLKDELSRVRVQLTQGILEAEDRGYHDGVLEAALQLDAIKAREFKAGYDAALIDAGVGADSEFFQRHIPPPPESDDLDEPEVQTRVVVS